MFLPVLMVRDFGFMGWMVFALPNVIGAAAMGWVLARPGAAQKIVAGHGIACQSFSSVTIAFHCFFVAWFVRALAGWPGAALATAGTVALYLLMRGGKRELIAASAVLLFSLAVFAWIVLTRGFPLAVFDPTIKHGANLLALSPVIAFGFVLCPYLDLTFLRARAMTTPNQGIAAFTLGFGVFFLLMILFTLCYAGWLAPSRLDRLPRVLGWIIAAHMIVQIAITAALHARPLLAADSFAPLRVLSILSWIVSFCTPLFWRTDIAMEWPSTYLARGEVGYRLFLGFYGLVFPAYVWICMIPPRRGAAIAMKSRIAVYVIAVVVAAPMFYLGFIGNRMVWLVPGIAVVLAARLLTSKGRAA